MLLVFGHPSTEVRSYVIDSTMRATRMQAPVKLVFELEGKNLAAVFTLQVLVALLVTAEELCPGEGLVAIRAMH